MIVKAAFVDAELVRALRRAWSDIPLAYTYPELALLLAATKDAPGL